MVNPPEVESIGKFWSRHIFPGSTNRGLNNGYLKFYWHGKMIYLEQTLSSFYMYPMACINNNYSHGIDLGGKGKRIVDFNNTPMVICMFMLGSRCPNDDSQTAAFGQYIELLDRCSTWFDSPYYVWTHTGIHQRGINYTHPNNPPYKVTDGMTYAVLSHGHDMDEPLSRDIWHNANDVNTNAFVSFGNYRTFGMILYYSSTWASGRSGPWFIFYDPLYQSLYNR